jgi:hypothetical protein
MALLDQLQNLIGDRTASETAEQEAEAQPRNRPFDRWSTEEYWQNLVKRTSVALWTLLCIGGSVLVLIGLYALFSGNWHFFIWSTIVAVGATVAGAGLGVLFGLPTVRRVEVRDGNAGNAGSLDGQVQTGYVESTSLEQIADWLTKIIVGLTLTQYPSWEQRFERLSTNVTSTLLSDEQKRECLALTQLMGKTNASNASTFAACPTSAPGGIMLVAYAFLGFLIAYLWMRRFFILEMVGARTQIDLILDFRALAARQQNQIEKEATERAVLQAAEKAQQREEQEVVIEKARSLGLAEGNPTRLTVTDPMVTSLAEKGVGRLSPGSHAVEQINEIKQAVSDIPTDPEDPWRNKFGGVAEANNTVLDAPAIEATAADPQFFQISLEVRGLTQERKLELNGTKAIYYLHPTFGNEPRTSIFGPDGRAPLEIFAYGAFTVGVLLEQDGTKLELNLATLPNAPDRFRSR